MVVVVGLDFHEIENIRQLARDGRLHFGLHLLLFPGGR